MICKQCRERDHDHCLNFGKWSTESREFTGLIGGVSVFERRDEPTETWCDCQHDLSEVGVVSHKVSVVGYSWRIEGPSILADRSDIAGNDRGLGNLRGKRSYSIEFPVSESAILNPALQQQQTSSFTNSNPETSYVPQTDEDDEDPD